MRLLFLTMLIHIIPLITANTIFIPRVVLQAGYPSGFRAFVPDFPGMQYFSFHGQVNPISGPPQILRRIIRAPVNGYWIYQDDNCQLRTNDVVSYSTHMVINRVPYKSSNMTWTCPQPNQFVDFKAPLPPVRRPPIPSQQNTTPTPESENTDLRNVFSSPPPELKSESPLPEASTQSTSTETKKESPGTSPGYQSTQPTLTSSNTQSTPTTETTSESSQSTPPKESTPMSSPSTPIKETTPLSTKSTPTTETTPSNSESTPPKESSPTSTLTTPTTTTTAASSQPTPSTQTTPSKETSTPPEEPKTPEDVKTTPTNEQTTEPSTEVTKASEPSTTPEKSTEPSPMPSEPTEPSPMPSEPSSPLPTASKSPVSDRRSDDSTDPAPTDEQEPENKVDSTTPSTYIPVSELPEEPNNENQPLFPGPFKPMMPPKGPSFEICSNPWNFVPRENETKTQKLEKQVAKLQCDLALFQRKFMQLGQVLEGELTDIKQLNTGVANRMSKLESVLKAPLGPN